MWITYCTIIINGEKAMKEAINIFEICDGVVTIYRKNAANTWDKVLQCCSAYDFEKVFGKAYIDEFSIFRSTIL